MTGKQTANRHQGWLVALMISGAAAIVSSPALAVDNPFSMENRSKVKLVNLECQGPAWRLSDHGIDVNAGADSGVFYTATGGLFSQFGSWNCTGSLESLDGPDVNIFFCLENIVNERDVVLFLPKGGGLDSNLQVEVFPNITQGGNCDGPGAVAGFLGDGPRRGPEPAPLVATSSARTRSGTKERADRDHWLLDGTAGDSLTIRLSRDGSAGSQGEQATLVLRGHGAAESFEKTVSGALPLELAEQLPADAPYSVAVEQHSAKQPDRFLGAYILALSSDLNEALSLRPHTTVEP